METITKNTLVSISLKTENEGGYLLEENEEIMYHHAVHGQIFQKLETEFEGKKLGHCSDRHKDDIIFHQQ